MRYVFPFYFKNGYLEYGLKYMNDRCNSIYAKFENVPLFLSSLWNDSLKWNHQNLAFLEIQIIAEIRSTCILARLYKTRWRAEERGLEKKLSKRIIVNEKFLVESGTTNGTWLNKNDKTGKKRYFCIDKSFKNARHISLYTNDRSFEMSLWYLMHRLAVIKGFARFRRMAGLEGMTAI